MDNFCQIRTWSCSLSTIRNSEVRTIRLAPIVLAWWALATWARRNNNLYRSDSSSTATTASPREKNHESTKGNQQDDHGFQHIVKMVAKPDRRQSISRSSTFRQCKHDPIGYCLSLEFQDARQDHRDNIERDVKSCEVVGCTLPEAFHLGNY